MYGKPLRNVKKSARGTAKTITPVSYLPRAAEMLGGSQKMGRGQCGCLLCFSATASSDGPLLRSFAAAAVISAS